MATYDDKAGDWQLASIGGFAYAKYGGAGIYGFRLRSASLKLNEPFMFAATGLGMGGNASGIDLNNLDGLQYSDAGVQTPFSVRQIHRSAGTMVSGSIAVDKSGPMKFVNIGWSRLDLAVDGVTFFASSGFGRSAGSGTGGYAFAGTWYSYALNNNSINPVTPYWENVKEMAQSVADLPGRLDREIRRLYTGF